jgi:hypothetical protein
MVCCEAEEKKKGFLQKEMDKLPGSAVEVSPRGAFPFLKFACGSASGVARGSCGWDRVCLPLKATIKMAGSPQWSRHNGVARCTVAIFKGSDA